MRQYKTYINVFNLIYTNHNTKFKFYCDRDDNKIISISGYEFTIPEEESWDYEISLDYFRKIKKELYLLHKLRIT